MPHVVFAWEIGSGFGHLAPIAALGDEFRRRGYRVTAVVADPGRSQPVLGPLGIEVVGLPLHPAPPRAFPVSVNYTANLLRNGYWHGPTASRRIETWRDLLSRLEPDLLVCDHAPGALLASRGASYATAAVGTGFTLPPLATPMPCVQPWFPIPADRLRETDRRFLDTVNPLLGEAALPPLETVASLFDGVERFLCVEPELDHYDVRPHETYWGTIDPVWPLPRPELPADGAGVVFVYMSATNRFLGPVMDALRERHIAVIAYIAGHADSQVRERPNASNIHWLDTPVELKEVAARCCLTVTQGGTASTSLLLKQGVKLLVCPQDLEKAVLAARLRNRTLALALNWYAPDTGHVGPVIDSLLDSSDLPHGLGAFVASHAHRSAGDNVRAIVERLCRASVDGAHR